MARLSTMLALVNLDRFMSSRAISLIPIRLALVLLGLAVLGFAPAPQPKPDRFDTQLELAKLQGNWRLTRYEMLGKSQIAEHERYRVTVEKSEWAFYRALGFGEFKKSTTYSIVLNLRSTPPTIDLEHSGGNTFKMVGIYRLRNNKMTVIFHVNPTKPGSRPTSLDNPDKSDCIFELEKE